MSVLKALGLMGLNKTDEEIHSLAENLSGAMAAFEITTPLSQAMFLAQTAHASALYRFTSERGLPSSFRRYEGRPDLGNTEPGDGLRFKGRGYFLITGRQNYTIIGKQLEVHLLEKPELLEEPRLAAMSAAALWNMKRLSKRANCGDFAGITRALTGGNDAAADRRYLLLKCLQAYGLPKEGII